MASTVARLPDAQLEPLARAYKDALAAKQRQILIGIATLVVALFVAGYMAEVRIGEFLRHIDRFPTYIVRLFFLDTGASVFTDIGEWFWGWKHWLKLLVETMLIAYTGTFLGALAAFVLSFVISANLSRTAWLRISVKRFLEFCRTVPELVFALIFVVAFGLGPVPGVLAIAIHTMGALGKQFSEVVENIDMKPVEGITATGATWWETVRFAAVPQVLSNFASYALLRFEINVRGAAVMGFVGAGGIGQDLIEAIRKFYNSDVSAILILIIVAVMLIDLGTERLRHALLGKERS
ncbi:MAG: phosphonate ABC transporter, permease protein PhnE [Hyphomicrobiaceae bacterium]|nr:phosphonate ABC transporter, permease protein PhnE [Hyphomicrobiaceae bacterium]